MSKLVENHNQNKDRNKSLDKASSKSLQSKSASANTNKNTPKIKADSNRIKVKSALKSATELRIRLIGMPLQSYSVAETLISDAVKKGEFIVEQKRLDQTTTQPKTSTLEVNEKNKAPSNRQKVMRFGRHLRAGLVPNTADEIKYFLKTVETNARQKIESSIKSVASNENISGVNKLSVEKASEPENTTLTLSKMKAMVSSLQDEISERTNRFLENADNQGKEADFKMRKNARERLESATRLSRKLIGQVGFTNKTDIEEINRKLVILSELLRDSSNAEPTLDLTLERRAKERRAISKPTSYEKRLLERRFRDLYAA